MQKDILFLVTGMTPQIITETLYALAADPENNDKWVPTEIHVLTTAKGKIQIRSRLFNDGIFEKFLGFSPMIVRLREFDQNERHGIFKHHAPEEDFEQCHALRQDQPDHRQRMAHARMRHYA